MKILSSKIRNKTSHRDFKSLELSTIWLFLKKLDVVFWSQGWFSLLVRVSLIHILVKCWRARIEILSTYIPNIAWDIFTLKYFFVYYVKLNFNWVSCVLYGNLMLERSKKWHLVWGECFYRVGRRVLNLN